MKSKQFWMFCITLALCATSAFGQTSRASVSGIVMDPSGGVVSGATVTVNDLDRGTVYTSKTNETGLYLVAELTPGRYRITAEAAGFRTYVLDAFPLQTQQRATLNITLQVGAVSEKIEVTATAQVVEASDATLSSVVENKKILDLPLNGRNIYSLMRLVPGVAPSTPNSDSSFFTSAHRYMVNGGRESTTDVHLDGVSTLVQSDIPGIYATSTEPSVDAVQEFRIQTNAFSAEYGRTGGGFVTMVTKSGTNEFHGSLFEFLRNSKFDSNTWQANRAGSKLPSLQRNQFGGSLGGRVIKDKTFFFFAFDGTRANTSGFGQWTVPTELERTGDFSQTLNASGQMRVVYDPFTTRPDPNNPGAYIRDPMSGNKIPVTRMDPVAQKIMTYWPKPNQPGQKYTNALNLGIRKSLLSPTDHYDAKVDHTINAKQRLFVRYDRLRAISGDYDYWGNYATPTTGTMTWGSHNVALDYTNTISSSTVFNGRIGVNRFSAFRPSFSYPFDASKNFGWSSEMQQVIAAYGITAFPALSVQDVATLGGIQGPYYQSGNTQWMFVASLTKIAGRHTLKTGFENRDFYLGFYQANGMPTMSFSRTMTQGPNPRSPSELGGYGFASFLFGTPDSGSIAHSPRTYNYGHFYGMYLQDDFKLTPKLTLNMGIRMEINGGNTERFDRMAINDLYVTNPVSSMVGFTVLGGYRFAGSGIGRRAIVDPLKNYSPRVGFAYAWNPKTSIRAGYGIFFGVPPFVATTNYIGGAYSSSTQMIATLDGITPHDTLQNPFPTNNWNLPPGTKLGLLTQVGQNLTSAVPADLRVPYNQQWNFTIQREVASGTVLELAYAGNKGTHLSMETWPNLNQLTPAQMDPSLKVNDLVTNPFYGIVTSGTLAQPTVQRGQLLRPWPLWQTVRSQNAGWGNSNYHALQARFERRFAQGASFMAAFTWSKTISDSTDGRWNDATGAFGGFRNAYCRSCERSISSYDVPRRLVLNFTYELPFGKGKLVGSHWNRWVNGVLGGWQANGILTVASGMPLEITQSSNTTFSFGGTQHPNSTGISGDLGSQRSVYRWFDTSQFTLAQPYTFGNLDRTVNIRQDFTRGLDFSIFKTGNIYKERVKLQFRAEAFNLSNTPIFSAPSANIQSATVGQVNSMQNSPRQVQLSLKVLF